MVEVDHRVAIEWWELTIHSVGGTQLTIEWLLSGEGQPFTGGS